jgi:hypothetical protein
MKSLLSIPTLLTVLFIAGVIALLPLSSPQISAYSDSDDSETNAEQRLGQKNLGSGESSDFNCDENMITSASGTDCIPSGAAPPTPPTPPPTGGPIISGTVSGEILCGTIAVQRSVFINVFENDDGTVAGIIEPVAGGPLLDVNGGTTDGSTFSISGPIGICGGAFTISGDCGTDIMVSYEEDDASGTLTGDVACTPI